jgi:hypothetical protein
MVEEHNERAAVVQSRELAETLGPSPAADGSPRRILKETPQC